MRVRLFQLELSSPLVVFFLVHFFSRLTSSHSILIRAATGRSVEMAVNAFRLKTIKITRHFDTNNNYNYTRTHTRTRTHTIAEGERGNDFRLY
jgi:hypothetical protein